MEVTDLLHVVLILFSLSLSLYSIEAYIFPKRNATLDTIVNTLISKMASDFFGLCCGEAVLLTDVVM